jgi:hypothetical protein
LNRRSEVVPRSVVVPCSVDRRDDVPCIVEPVVVVVVYSYSVVAAI